VIRTLVAFGVALGGGLLSALLARTHKQLCALISLGAGTLLGVTFFAIVPKCWNELAPWQFLLGPLRATRSLPSSANTSSTFARRARPATSTKRPRIVLARSRWP